MPPINIFHAVRSDDLVEEHLKQIPPPSIYDTGTPNHGKQDNQ